MPWLHTCVHGEGACVHAHWSKRKSLSGTHSSVMQVLPAGCCVGSLYMSRELATYYTTKCVPTDLLVILRDAGMQDWQDIHHLSRERRLVDHLCVHRAPYTPYTTHRYEHGTVTAPHAGTVIQQRAHMHRIYSFDGFTDHHLCGYLGEV